MANNTLGEEIWVILSDSEDDESIPNINEDEILRGLNNDEGSNSEEDELEREQTGRGEKRKAENQNEEIWVILSDSEDDELIPNINDEGSNSEEDELEREQTGRGEKRKAENQNEEQEQDYYQIKPIREHHSQKFNMTAKNYGVRFNNDLNDVDLLESRKRTYGIFDHLIKDVTEGMNPNDQVRFILSSDQLQTPIAIPFCSLEELTTEIDLEPPFYILMFLLFIGTSILRVYTRGVIKIHRMLRVILKLSQRILQIFLPTLD